MEPSLVQVDIETREKGNVIARVTIANERKLNTLNSRVMTRFVEEMEKSIKPAYPSALCGPDYEILTSKNSQSQGLQKTPSFFFIEP